MVRSSHGNAPVLSFGLQSDNCHLGVSQTVNQSSSVDSDCRAQPSRLLLEPVLVRQYLFLPYQGPEIHIESIKKHKT
jgi:hypothetical protein